MSESFNLTEYKIKTKLAKLSYLKPPQRTLVAAVIEIRGAMSEPEMRDVLQQLINAKLLSRDNQKSILKKFFQE